MTWTARLLSALAAAVLLPLLCPATALASSWTGTLPASTTWRVADNPVLIYGYVTVPAGGTLIIEPGVDVQLAPAVRIYVNGTLQARGTATAPILFQPWNANAKWDGLTFNDSSADAVYNEAGEFIGGSILEHAVITGALNQRNSYDQNPAIEVLKSSPLLQSLTLERNVVGIQVSFDFFGPPPGGVLKIRRCRLVGQSNAAMRLYYGAHHVVVEDNVIDDNASGIWFQTHTGARGEFRRNTFSRNLYGLSFEGYYGNLGTLEVTDNVMTSNDMGLRLFFTTATSVLVARNRIQNNIGSGGAWIGMDGANPIALEVSDNIISGNTGFFVGGLYIVTKGTAAVLRNVITDNSTTSDRPGDRTVGGLELVMSDYLPLNVTSTATVAGNLIARNSAPAHPALHASATALTLTGNTITGNRTAATGEVPAMSVSGGATVTGNNIFDNAMPYALQTAVSTSPVNAAGNWWGGPDARLAALFVNDFLDNPTRALATVAPVLAIPTPDAPIAPPSGLTVAAVNGALTLAWKPNREGDIRGYRVWYGTPGQPYTGQGAHAGPSPIDVGNVTTFTLTGLPATPVAVTVTAYDGDPNAGAPGTSGHESWFAAEERRTFVPAGAPCVYAVPVTRVSVGAAGGSVAVSVIGGSGCTWSASSQAAWLSTSGTGSGSSTAVYQVQANNSGAQRQGTAVVAGQVVTVVQAAAFTDDPLIQGSWIRATHVAELRTRIDLVRARFGLASYAWEPGVTPYLFVKASHILELRAALGQAQAVAGTPLSAYVDADLGPGTTIKMAHISDLRQALIGLESR